MRVTATHPGFYVKLRKPGDEFDVTERVFSARWMKRVEVAEPVEIPAAAEAPKTTEPIAAQAAETVVKKRRGRRPKAVSE